ncbi:TetR family transcriptional regulator [Streptomyces lasalocidi]
MAERTPKQERSQRTRAALLQAAAEIFGESGFAGASVNKIATRAGLTLGALYFHFENKESVAREIVRMQPSFVPSSSSSDGLQRAVDITLGWAYGLLRDPMLVAWRPAGRRAGRLHEAGGELPPAVDRDPRRGTADGAAQA